MLMTKRLKGGRTWNRVGDVGWRSEDGKFDILVDVNRGYVVLVAFDYEPAGDSDQDFWTRAFSTIEEAMEQAEVM